MTISKKQKVAINKSKISKSTSELPIERRKATPSKAKNTKTEIKKTKTPSRKQSTAEEESDSDLDDNLDVQEESDNEEKSDSSESSSDEEDSEDDSFPLRKSKKETDDGKESFANAFNAIIGSKLKAYDRKDPILARNKTTHKKLESEKLEAKARRAIRFEKQEEQDKHRVKHLLPKDPTKIREALEAERAMKKVAQKGVVMLFNAILATQLATSEESSVGTGSLSKDPELVTELTKLTFLDLVKAAGQD